MGSFKVAWHWWDGFADHTYRRDQCPFCDTRTSTFLGLAIHLMRRH